MSDLFSKPWNDLTEEEKNNRLKLISGENRLFDSDLEGKGAPAWPETDVAPTANARQVGGDHYRTSIQHWDYVWANGLDYFQAQITKYVSRWKKKGRLQDLHKARHFLDKYIELNEREACEPQAKGYINQD